MAALLAGVVLPSAMAISASQTSVQASMAPSFTTVLNWIS